MPKKIKRVYKYKDWILDSQGEVEMCYYLQELQDNGYIESFERGVTFKLSEGLTYNYTTINKRGSKSNKETVLREHEYTPDFFIKWHVKAMNIFYTVWSNKWEKFFLNCSNKRGYIECKPSWDYNNMERLVKLNIKWMWQKYQVYVQIVKNEDLFKETFVPKALLTTKTGKKRVFKFEIRTLEEYIQSQEKQ